MEPAKTEAKGGTTPIASGIGSVSYHTFYCYTRVGFPGIPMKLKILKNEQKLVVLWIYVLEKPSKIPHFDFFTGISGILRCVYYFQP